MRILIFLLVGLVAISISVNAISVASDYLVNDTLVLKEGESKIYSIRLQNPTEYEIGIKLDYDKSLMKLINYQEIYILPPKTTGYRLEFNVTAPKKPGLYSAGYTVSEVEPSGGGGLPIRLKINRNFNIKVIEEPNNFYIKNEYIAYAVIVLSFLIYVYWKEYLSKHRYKNKHYKLKKKKIRYKNRKIIK